MPLNDLMVYTGDKVNNMYLPLFEAHKKVRQSKLPNFMGCRIPVKSQLNPAVFYQELEHYWDKQLCHSFWIPFGF